MRNSLRAGVSDTGSTGTQTNTGFAKSNSVFLVACKLAGLPATKRQASKFRNGRGRAHAQRARAASMLASNVATITPAGIVVINEQQEVANV